VSQIVSNLHRNEDKYQVLTMSELPLQFDLTLLTPSVLTPSRRLPERRFHGETWLYVGRAANIKRGTQQSRIWEYGDEYVQASNPEGGRYWLCDACDMKFSPMVPNFSN
jgi:hypothetical protein